tara:strand:+ start:348 stop:2180 length:1833 start_codon:yes stop_codon:yes gene_type:complete
MAITTDRNITRENLVDWILSNITAPSGEITDIWRGSIEPKVIRGGQITDSDGEVGENEKRVLFSKDYKAVFGYPGDFIDDIIDNCYTYGNGTIDDLTELDFTSSTYDDAINQVTLDNCIVTSGTDRDAPYTFTIDSSRINEQLSQYVTFDTGSMRIDSVRAEQVLDTNIYELLPTDVTRQQRINKFFNEFYQLVGEVPGYDLDVDFDGILDTWNLPEISQEQDLYSSGSVHHNPVDGAIVRLDRHGEGTVNETQTLESLRRTINTRLTDIDKQVNPSIEDTRPEYKSKSDGYLKIRSLNQGILVRNEQQDDVGVVGPDVNDPLYLRDGFTIAMWTRFLDRTGGGTLFNFGNPIRSDKPMGFRLETYTLHKYSRMRPDKDYTWDEYIRSHTEGSAYIHTQVPENLGYFDEEHDFFVNNDYERFVRLMVREADGGVRESSVGTRRFKEGILLTKLNMQLISKVPSNGEYPIIWPEDQSDADTFYPNRLLTYTRIPIDFNEWFYIVATYNPNINEDLSHEYRDEYAPDGVNTLKYFSEFWQGHVEPLAQNPTENQIAANADLDGLQIGKYVTRSGLGNRCKVEVISRSQLLRGLGFKSDVGDIEDDTSQVVGG